MGLKGQVVPVTPFQQNCSIIWSERTMVGTVVDPGGDLPRIRGEIDRLGVTVEKVLLTHGHVDHAAGAGSLAEALGVPIEGPHEADRFLIEDLPEQASRFGFGEAAAFEPGRWLDEGDTVAVSDLVLEVRHCPGHTPGHIIFIHRPSGIAIVGDVLFQGSIGRTDLPGGDHAALVNSIRTTLWPLGGEMAFLPGHGPMSTFAAERQSNPFVGDQVLGRGG